MKDTAQTAKSFLIMHNAFSLTLILRGATFLYNIHFSYLSTAAGLLPFPAAFVLIKGTLSFIRLCFVSFFAGLVTTRVERASSGLWSLCTQVDNVSNLTCEDWREESCESFVMASRLSRQYLRQKKYESELLCCVFCCFVLNGMFYHMAVPKTCTSKTRLSETNLSCENEFAREQKLIFI